MGIFIWKCPFAHAILDGNGVLPEKKEDLVVEVPGQNLKHSASNF